MQLSPGSADGTSNRFEATRWSVVVAAGRKKTAPAAARAALAQLCQTYWSPLYEFIRSRGHPVHDAQDLTQGFFAHLIERRIYTRTSRAKGKFRSFLLASVKNFLSDAYDRENALKRGGACVFLPLHDDLTEAAEASFQSRGDPGAGAGTTADQLFERQWAETLLAAALGRVRAEAEADGKRPLFTALEIFLRDGADDLPSYDQLAVQLAMPAVTVRSHVARFRARYRAALRDELRRTVLTEKEVDEELRELRRVLTAR